MQCEISKPQWPFFDIEARMDSERGGTDVHFFEATMLVCFGAAWPISIIRSYRSRSTKGKSGLFSIVVIVGYLCGILNKALYQPDFVIALYALNLIMVAVDFCLWIRNRRLEGMKGAEA